MRTLLYAHAHIAGTLRYNIKLTDDRELTQYIIALIREPKLGADLISNDGCVNPYSTCLSYDVASNVISFSNKHRSGVKFLITTQHSAIRSNKLQSHSRTYLPSILWINNDMQILIDQKQYHRISSHIVVSGPAWEKKIFQLLTKIENSSYSHSKNLISMM